MERVQVQKEDFSDILRTIERLIDKVENILSRDEIAKSRIMDIKEGKIQGRTETELDSYLKKRGVKLKLKTTKTYLNIHKHYKKNYHI